MPAPPRHQKVGDFPGSSVEEIENEPSWDSIRHHKVGIRSSRGHFSGLTHEEFGHWENEAERDLAEDAMKRQRDLRRRHDKGDLLNFRDIMQAQTDFKKHDNARYPPTWHFVVDSTEDFVKNQQDWPANIERRKKEQEKEQQQQKDDRKTGPEKGGEQGQRKTKQVHENGHDETQSKQQDSDNFDRSTGRSSNHDSDVDDNAEDDFRQNRGGENSTKHNNAYGSRLHSKQDADAEYKRLRQKYTPQEIALLRSLQHEREHIHNLQQNDGTVVSPVKVEVSERDLLGIDAMDTMTPDNWIPRSPNLIRQTGQHPMNAEPDFRALFDAGMITPNHLHYVRNHGAVPRLYWETHVLDVNNGQMRLTMDDLADNFEQINVAFAMGCDGVRRGELNKIRRTKGFTWGSGAISNAYWRGPRLCDVLAAAGVSRKDRDPERRLFVNFEGADHPSEGKYQTSVSFEHVMDPNNDVVLAYEMNNTPLPPDHGFPLRVVIPGYVGGRCVKWLSRVWISETENDSHYHIWDNRVLPAFVTEKDGEFAQTLFRHPDTSCYEQNLNSMIARPAQDEKISLEDLLKQPTYRIEGIAYDGGGHQVQRVEVSIDEGKTWLYAVRKFPKNSVRNGNKFWTWCFWHVDVDSLHFSRAPSIVVRAFNVFKNTQPAEPSWNILGMMNNCWYRVKMSPDQDLHHVVCRHPVDPKGDRGWMKESTENQLNAAKQSSGVPDKQFTRQEIEKHNKKDDCWLVINNQVYDCTSVLAWHPGGPATILANSGKLSIEVTTSFESVHDDYAYKKLQECAIGRVTEKAAKYLRDQAKADAEQATSPSDSRVLLQSKRWVPVKLIKRDQLSQDVFEYVFQYRESKSQKRLGLGTCQHIEFGIHMQDKMLVRQYTPTKPILESDDDGTITLVVKTYYPDDNQPGGAFGNMLLNLEIGEMVQVSGPSGEIEYLGKGQFNIESNKMNFEKVNLILGGSGITPGFQLIDRILREGDDSTKIRVVDANKTEKDILLKEQLDDFQTKHKDQIEITHVLSHPDEDSPWAGEKGHVNEDIIKKACFAPGEGVATFLCGPPTMIQKAALPALLDWGFEEDKNVFGF